MIASKILCDRRGVNVIDPPIIALHRAPHRHRAAGIPMPCVLALSFLLLLLCTVPLSSQEGPAWRYVLGGASVGPPIIGRDGTIYVISEDRYLYALNTEGQLSWRYNLAFRPVTNGVLTPSGSILAGLRNGTLQMIDGNGALIWSYQFVHSPNVVVIHSIAVSPREIIYLLLSDGTCYAITLGGRLLWSFNIGGEPSTPLVIGDDDHIYFGLTNGMVKRYNSDAEMEWEVELGLGPATLAVTRDNRLLAGNNILQVIDADGMIQDLFKGWSAIEQLYINESGVIYVQYRNRMFGALDIEDISAGHIRTIETIPIVGGVVTGKGEFIATGADGSIVELLEDRKLTRIAQWPHSQGLFHPMIIPQQLLVALGGNWVLYAFPVNTQAGAGWISSRGNYYSSGTPTQRIYTAARSRDPIEDERLKAIRELLISPRIENKFLALDMLNEFIIASEFRGHYDTIIELLIYAVDELYLRPKRFRQYVFNDYPVVRRKASQMLAQIGDGRARGTLAQLVGLETNRVVLLELLDALAIIGGDPNGAVAHALVLALDRERNGIPSYTVIAAIQRAINGLVRYRGKIDNVRLQNAVYWIANSKADLQTRYDAQRLLDTLTSWREEE